ncbi:MAG: sulfotransferase family protein [Candidatus Binatia bacterium]
MNFRPGIRVNEIGTNYAFGDTVGRKAHGSTKAIIKKTKQLVRVIQSTIKVDNWPTPTDSPLVSDPTFIFIITPPYSGSTALAQVLNSAHRSTLIQKRGEGQWLVPGMCQADRWNPDKYIDWKSVKAVWSSRIRFIEEHVGKVNVVIEKSPPNLVRTDRLLETFPKHKIVAFNRNPYASCASVLYRVHDGRDKSKDERTEIIRRLAATWVFRSGWLKKQIETYSPIHFTYENFCNDPEAAVKRITDDFPELIGIDTTRAIKVKDYRLQGISNQNERQIGNLSESERSVIGAALRSHEELLQFFGYTSEWEKDVEQGGAGDVAPRRARP